MTDYNDKLKNFASRLKSEQVSVHIQEIKPINTELGPREIQTQLNVWIPKPLMKKLKQLSIEQELTIRDFVIVSIQKYVDNISNNNKN